MTKTLTAPMKLADEMLSTVAGGHDHGRRGCWKRERGHGHGRRFFPGSSKSVDQDVDVTIDASNNSGTIIINVNTSA
ncbi:MAG TPA: hypothetical protein VFK85_02095 [Anaeromyxobacteraceae bacterium]|nr:hypothetical protein [Anaeromyxobacteraceae bacterium]